MALVGTANALERASDTQTRTRARAKHDLPSTHVESMPRTTRASERRKARRDQLSVCAHKRERQTDRHDSAAGGDMAKVAMMVSVCVGERERGGRWLGGGADSLLSLALSPSFIAHTRRVASYVRRLLCALPFREPSTLRGDAPLGLRGSRGAFVCSERPTYTARDSRYLSTESGGCAQIS